MRDRSTSVVKLFAVVGLLCLAAAPAVAGSAQEHDQFFMRAAVGICAGNAQLESGGSKAKLDDPGLDVNVAAGYCLIPNLAVHATLWGWGLNDPDVHLSGQFGGTTVANKGILEMIAFGAGATYYVMPLNGLHLQLDRHGRVQRHGPAGGQSERGFAVDVTAGKEWWVTDDWARARHLSYSHFSADDKDLGPATLPRGSSDRHVVGAAVHRDVQLSSDDPKAGPSVTSR
jgi:hypothetical protein